MTECLSIDIERMGDMKIANADLDNPETLERQWRADGYLYFKNVLDLEALDAFRQPILDKLKAMGVVDADSREPIYSGHDLDKFGARMLNGYENPDGIYGCTPWLEFVQSAKVAAFFRKVLGYEPTWIPVIEVRMVPPDEPRELRKLVFPHQDQFYNGGYEFAVAWLPLFDSPRLSGGLAVARSQNHRGLLHDGAAAPHFPIPPGTIPEHVWETTDYEAGDVVLFRKETPHSGIRNHSKDRFRLSMDVRWMPPGEKPIVLGLVEASSPESITVRQDDGTTGTYRLTPATYIRAFSIVPVKLEEVPAAFPVGQEAFLALDGDKVHFLRYPKY